MGQSCAGCPQPVQALFETWGIASSGGGHPSGIVLCGTSYATVKLIGEGGYAFVYEAICNSTGRSVALKRHVFTDDSQRAAAETESRIYQSIPPHPNIVQLVASDTTIRPRCPFPERWTVMELCPGPSLQDYMNNRISLAQSFSVREVYEIVDNIVHAIGHLHSQSPPIAHFDIKPDNFLFSESGTLKLCDFGSATTLFYQPRTPSEIDIAQSELESRMTLLFRPPESLDLWMKKRTDVKADVWALGVLCYTLVFKEMPFEGSAAEIVDGVPKRFRGSEADTTPADFKPLMSVVNKFMLVKDPALRGDVFTVSEELAKINYLAPLERPATQVPQQPRFR